MNRTSRTAKSVIALLIVLSACVFLGCKSEEQIQAAQNNSSSAPRVIFNEAADDQPNTLSVSGSGEVIVEPDSAKIIFSVVSRGKKAEEVQQNNNVLIAAITEAILNNNINQTDIKTAFISMNETYDYNKEPATVTGYEVSNSITVTVRDIAVIGQLVSDATAAGASSYEGPDFSLLDSSEAYNDALQAAVQDARQKADALAEAAGAAIAALPLSISEQSYSTTATLYRAEETATLADNGDGASAQVPVSTGELTVSADVTIVYELIPMAAEPTDDH